MEDYIESILKTHSWFTLLDEEQADKLIDRIIFILMSAPWFVNVSAEQEAAVIEQLAYILAHAPWIRSAPPDRPNGKLIKDSLENIQTGYQSLMAAVRFGRIPKAHEPNQRPSLDDVEEQPDFLRSIGFTEPQP